MRINEITLKNGSNSVIIKNNVFLAPMAGYTDYAFRRICLEAGAGLCFTELTSAKGMLYDSPNTVSLLKKSGGSFDRDVLKNDPVMKEPGLTSAQLFGSDPDDIYNACTGKYLTDYDLVDINMGCPVPKVYKNGEGSALLKDVLTAEKIVKAAVKSGKIVSVKIRIGLSENSPYVTEEFAKMTEASGGAMLTVHGRTRDKYYSGDVNFKEIEKAKNAVGIPVIANGGIFTVKDADEIMSKTGADGVMLARGAVANPFLFSSLLGLKRDEDRVKLIFKHIDYMKEDFSDRYVTLNIRKFLGPYFSGRRNASKLCKELYALNSTDEIKETLVYRIHITDEV